MLVALPSSRQDTRASSRDNVPGRNRPCPRGKHTAFGQPTRCSREAVVLKTACLYGKAIPFCHVAKVQSASDCSRIAPTSLQGTVSCFCRDSPINVMTLLQRKIGGRLVVDGAVTDSARGRAWRASRARAMGSPLCPGAHMPQPGGARHLLTGCE